MSLDAEEKKTNPVKVIDCGCRTVSCAVLLFMVVLLIVSATPWGEQLPCWLASGSLLRKYLLPILCSAAVGYLTNAVAIWMLFKPYEKHWFWPQGVIPGQKKSFGRELGILIPQYLLQPEKISAKIGKVALQYLKDPVFVQQVRVNVRGFLDRNRDKLADAVVPCVQGLSVRTIRDLMTRENFDRFCQSVIHDFLSNAGTREKTVRGAVALFRDLLPGFSADLQKIVAAKVAESVRRKHPVLSWFKETFTSQSLEDEANDLWRQGERELLEELERKETQEKIAGYFTRALLMAKEWAERPENAGKIDLFLRERCTAAEKYAEEYIAEKIPTFADEILAADSFWTMLQEKALPALQLYVAKQLHENGNSLLAKFDIPGKIENAVDGMEMKALHHFVVKASNDNLTVLQVLGFFLGGAAGVIMSFVL